MKSIFVFQFTFGLLIWAFLIHEVALPYVRKHLEIRSFVPFLIPQLFRYIGTSQMVPSLVLPTMPATFSIPLAVGDVATSILTLVALISTLRSWRGYLAWTSVSTVFGLLDAVFNLVNGVRLGALEHMQGSWFIPAFGLPFLITCHVTVLLLLSDNKLSLLDKGKLG